MATYTYSTILKKAKECQTSVKKEYKTTISWWWSYYFAKIIVNGKKDVKKITIKDASNPNGTHISRQIAKADITDICKRLIKWVEAKKQLPNYVSYKNYQINPRLLCELLSRVLINFDKNGKLAKEYNINSKCFIKPTETENKVYDGFVKKTGKKFTTIDDLLAYVKAHGRYIFEFDDVRSNAQVTSCMCGNCTDWLQWLWNMAKAMGYDVKCIHVKCKQSGTGHVFGKFKHKKNTGGNWITRDPASVANGGAITSVWCSDGYVQAVNPDWFLENLNR